MNPRYVTQCGLDPKNYETTNSAEVKNLMMIKLMQGNRSFRPISPVDSLQTSLSTTEVSTLRAATPPPLPSAQIKSSSASSGYRTW